ncbi:DNA-binding protein [Streptomyces lavendulocolor]|uniref:DNA-binding protein n=1 Tax=Streptomyces lavendulocolor TaxID=67316 RepID=UPI003C2B63A1
MSTTITTTTTAPVAAPDPAPAAEAALLLDAGAVLPAGTEGAGPDAVDLTARVYRHPGLPEGRVVVRLAAAELGAAEDLAAGFLGLVPDADPAVVGLGRRQALGFPEWVLVHHPEDGHHALALVPELEGVARRAKTKPKAALEAVQELADRLAASLPHFLPVFYEEAARVFLAVENPTYAAQLFTKARKSEANHGLTIDEDRLDAAFLEFALAGALPVRVLTSYAKELELRVPAPQAYERFRRLCVRRTAGGMVPSAQVAAALRRLARAAGLDPAVSEQDYLAELLPLPATLRAATGWWKTHRPALVALARREPAVRGTLLNAMPQSDDYNGGETTQLWLDILHESGATAGLIRAAVPAEERSADGTAGWLERFHATRHTGWGRRPTLPVLLDVVERAADRLRAELAEPGREKGLRIGVQDADLLDLLLCLDVPVADPVEQAALNLEDWALADERRDLRGLAADARFRTAFTRALSALGDHDTARTVMRRLAGSPGGRPVLADWVRDVARATADTGLPGFPQAVERLTWLPAEALVLAEEEVAAAGATDLGALLARTLRGGLFEELAWPAWEEALAELAPHCNSDLTVVTAWPHLIVANQRQVRVLDADSTVLVHDLRIPAGTQRTVGFHYVDGALLVCWRPWHGNGAAQAYWHTAPDRVFSLDTGKNPWRLSFQLAGLPLPGGGRATGAGVLHRGDTGLPEERPIISDGRSYWTWQTREEAAHGARTDRDGGPTDDGRTDGERRAVAGWVEYDPADGTTGRRSLPAFLTDAVKGHPRGSTLLPDVSWLRPAPTVEGSVLGAPADGLLGWRVVRLPDGGWQAGDTAGRTVTVPGGGDFPLAAVTFPGDDRPRSVSAHWREFRLTDPDGAVTAESHCHSGHGAPGGPAPKLPPTDHWFCLRPRDPHGSLALRAVDRDTAARLLATAADATTDDELPALVTAALPGVTDPILVQGIVSVLLFALTQRATLDGIAARLASAVRGDTVRRTPRGPADRVLDEALNGLTGTMRYGWSGGEDDGVSQALHAFTTAAADTGAAAAPRRLHTEMPALPHSALPWTSLLDHPAALAYRAAAAGTSEEHRTALLALLAQVDQAGLASAATGRWRRVVVHLAQQELRRADGTLHNAHHQSVLPLGGGAFLATTESCAQVPGGFEIGALQHDPAGRFAVPEPYAPRSGSPVGDAAREAGWLTDFLTMATERGAAPWLPEAAEEFVRLTGASGTVARLVVAGLPSVDAYERGFLTAEQRSLLGVKVAEAAVAREDIRTLTGEVRRRLVAALMPADPARLWTDGPDVAAAAEVWNRCVGRRAPLPEWLITEAHSHLKGSWPALRALPAVLDPASSPALGTDVAWTVKGDRIAPQQPAAPGTTGGRADSDDRFTADVLTGAVATLAWLAHRLPAGHPLRAQLPPALTAVRRRLAFPELMLNLRGYVALGPFRKAAGAPTRTTEHFEQYGAVVMATHDDQPMPAVYPALLDSAGSDPYLPLLRNADQNLLPVEAALRSVADPRFAALLADPGAPAAGATDAEGTWWPQDPGRSVPELVAEAATTYGLGTDAAALYLMLLAMPDPTDRNTARWTGWKPARAKAARTELAATDLVVAARRTRAGRGLFLPGGWVEAHAPAVPLEQWKAPLFDLLADRSAHLGVLVPTEPAAELYGRAWQRIREGDTPRFAELKVRRRARRR